MCGDLVCSSNGTVEVLAKIETNGYACCSKLQAHGCPMEKDVDIEVLNCDATELKRQRHTKRIESDKTMQPLMIARY